MNGLWLLSHLNGWTEAGFAGLAGVEVFAWLLGYPRGCPFHFHAAPNQFIEVIADTPFTTNQTKVFVVSGGREFTGYTESGIFYRLRTARQG